MEASALSSTSSMVPLVIAVGVPVIAGAIVGQACMEDIQTWYMTLRKPSWVPPAPVFGPVWSALYAAMGYASYLVWQTAATAARQHALKLYAVNVVMNLSWQLLFFKAKKLGVAQLENVALFGVAACTMGAFYKVDHLAGNLLLPYVIFVAFANLMNFSIWRKNPHATRIIEPLRDDSPSGLGGSDAPAASLVAAPGRSRPRLVVYSNQRPASHITRRVQAPRALRHAIPSRPTMSAAAKRASAAPCVSAVMKKNAIMA